MLAFKRKPYHGLKIALKLGLLFGVVLILFVFSSNLAQAFDFPFFDDFNSYIDGDLTGQGDWLGNGGQPFQVEGENVYEGLKAIKCLPVEGVFTYCESRKFGDEISAGFWRIYISALNCRPLTLYFMRNPGEYSFQVRVGKYQNKCYVWKGDYVEDEIIEVPMDYFDIFRRIENYTWSDWYSTNYHSLKGIRLSGGTDYINPAYVDFIAPDYTPECNSMCYFCDYLGCLDYPESCYWTGETCEPFFECGSDWLCEYCLSQEDCEAQDCYWNFEDDFCWSSVPPELPELEDCSGLGITDRLLCELKNFFYRLFVPSSQKIQELRDTTAEIREKFPYNYILEIKNFFAYLKDNVDENQEISFKILGQSGDVDFNFWNSETILAGESQTFLNIFKTFFKFIIILIFGLWCFSFLKRVFK
jgi:hypothetical protein